MSILLFLYTTVRVTKNLHNYVDLEKHYWLKLDMYENDLCLTLKEVHNPFSIKR